MFKHVVNLRAALLSCALLCVASQSSAQGFIEMPDTTEVPTFEKDSMLLDLDVPPLRDRDPDPTGGPRLNVKEFRLQGLVEYPKLGITRQKLIERVESIRFDLMRQDEIGRWGYTEEEVSEIASMMGDIESEIQDEHVGSVEVQKLVFLIREQRRKRGVTLGMIEAVADEITQFYRERGFILAKAYIPEQKVRDGVVTLTLLLGELGGVAVLDKKRVSEALIERAFKSHINEPVTNQRLEEALFLVNDIPGLTARSVLSPGTQVGDTLLNVNIQDESWYSSNLRADNFGSEDTSKNRAYADVYVHNPSGLGDQLHLAVLQTFSPNTGTFGSFRYSSFWGQPRLRTSVGISTNDFSSRPPTEGQQGTQFTGKSTVASASLDYVISRLRVKNTSIGLMYSNIDTELTIANLAGTDKSNAKQLTLQYKFDVLNQKRRHVYLGSVGLNSVSTTQPDQFSASGNLELDNLFLTYNLSMLMFLNVPFTESETRLLLNHTLQYAGKESSNIIQTNLTGIGKARIFGVNAFQADDGATLSADWIFPLPNTEATFFGEAYNRVFQPYLFVDYAYGQVYELDNGLQSNTQDGAGSVDDTLNGTFANIGLGLKFNFKKFNANLFAGTVLIDKVNEIEDSKTTNSVNFEFSYSL